MMKTFRFNLTFAILASLSLLLILTWLLLSLISFKTAEKDLLAQKSEEGRILLSSFLHLLPDSFPADTGLGSAERFAVSLASEKSFSGILIIDYEGREICRRSDPGPVDARLRETLKTGQESAAISGNRLLLSRYAPVRKNGETIGAARLSLSLNPEYERLSRSRHLYLTYFILDFLLLLAFGSYLLSRLIVSPIRRLLTATGRIAAGDLNCRVPVPGSSELAELAESFNAMVETLKLKRSEVEGHISSLERINRELEEAREETVRSEKMASIGLLAAGTAHEIGTPLAAIIGYAGLLREEPGNSEETADYLARIEEEAGRIDRIVRGLLDYARPTPVVREEVDMEELLRTTLEMLGEQGVFKDIGTSLSVEPLLPRPRADRQELQQVFANLFINARDAMPAGGTLTVHAAYCADLLETLSPEGRKTIRGRRREDFGGAFQAQLQTCRGSGFLRIDVADTGAGIASEHLEKIFDPFFTTKEPGKGTGLGLAVTARIIDSVGGRITVESRPDRGSVFTVWLPIDGTAPGPGIP